MSDAPFTLPNLKFYQAVASLPQNRQAEFVKMLSKDLFGKRALLDEKYVSLYLSGQFQPALINLKNAHAIYSSSLETSIRVPSTKLSIDDRINMTEWISQISLLQLMQDDISTRGGFNPYDYIISTMNYRRLSAMKSIVPDAIRQEAKGRFDFLYSLAEPMDLPLVISEVTIKVVEMPGVFLN